MCVNVHWQSVAVMHSIEILSAVWALSAEEEASATTSSSPSHPPSTHYSPSPPSFHPSGSSLNAFDAAPTAARTTVCDSTQGETFLCDQSGLKLTP